MLKLSQVAALIPGSQIIGDADPEITRVDYDSRLVESGSLFVAIEGAKTDGHKFVPQAFERGAAAAAVQHKVRIETSRSLIVVPDCRRTLAIAAAELSDHPDRHMKLAAVTGTNGKTTTVYLLADIFSKAWSKSGMIGTLGHRIGDRLQAQDRTTPEASDIFCILAQMRREGCRAVAMEVSSHALALGRVYGLNFAVAAFTNLSQDHLDFHGDLESYFQAKAALFRDYAIGAAIINMDDPYGVRLINMLPVPVLSYSMHAGADVRVVSINLSLTGIQLLAKTPRGEVEVSSPLLGTFNAYNVLCALAVAEVLDISHEDFRSAVAGFRGAPGRMQGFDLGGRWAYVDYAHTPDALKLALQELRRLAHGPVHVLFGCGGDRDRTKRPLMGKIAEENTARAYVTTDNPRSEDAEAIIAEILGGMLQPDRAVVIPDRRSAIARALRELPSSAVLLIAGKGHETYQEIAGVKHPFDDCQEVRRFLQERSG